MPIIKTMVTPRLTSMTSVVRLPYAYDGKGAVVPVQHKVASYPHLPAAVRDLAAVVTGEAVGERNQAAKAMIGQIEHSYQTGMTPYEAQSSLGLLHSLDLHGRIRAISELADRLRSQIMMAEISIPYHESFIGRDHKFLLTDAGGFIRTAGWTHALDIEAGSNQDCMTIAKATDGSELTVIGDGMGGAIRSDVASEIIVSTVAAQLADGNDFEFALSTATTQLKKRRVDIIVNHLLTELVDFSRTLSGDDSEKIRQQMNLVIEKNYVSIQPIELLKTEINNFILNHSSDGKFSFSGEGFKQLGSRLRLQANYFDLDKKIFKQEPTTTLVVSRKWQQDGITYVRDISVGDSGAALFDIDEETGSVGLIYQTKVHSLVQEMYDEGVFTRLAEEMVSDPLEVKRLAKMIKGAHPNSNVATLAVNYAGINVSSRNNSIQYEDTRDVELLPGRIYVRLAYTDRLPGAADLETEIAPLLKPGMNAQEILDAIHKYILEKNQAGARLMRQTLAAKKSQSPMPESVIPVPEHHFHGIRFAAYEAIDGGTPDDTTIVVDVIHT